MINASKGGRVTAGSISVDIPAGALSIDTKITAKVVESSKLPDAKLLVGDVYDLGPNGTKFLKPVTLAFDIGSAELAADEVPMLAFLAEDAWQPLDDSKLVDGKVTATTTHFTYFGVVRRKADAPVDSNAFGCDGKNPADGSWMCIDYSYVNPTEGLVDYVKEKGCTEGGGTVVVACDQKKAAGGCRYEKSDNGMVATTTVWGPATTQDLCDSGESTFVPGGREPSAGGNGSVFYCDSSASNQQCSEYSSPIAVKVDDFKMTCTDTLMGTLVASCPTGMVGGCRGGVESGDHEEHWTVWTYPPDTREEGDCGKSATFIPAP